MSIFRIAAVIAALAVPSAATAGLTFCNDSGRSQSIAIGYKVGESYLSRGWWNLDPGACKEVLTGDLTQRYYYYRMESRGYSFDGDYAFCAENAAFRIEGDTACATRGYDERRFRKIDTGKTAKTFTYTVTGSSQTALKSDAPAKTPAQPVPATPAPAQGFAPGTYGEPYSDAVTFQGCDSLDGPFSCSFIANLTRFHVYDDGRTPAPVMAALKSFAPGTPLSVTGDLAGIFDTTAEVVLSAATPRQPNNADKWLAAMQGGWYATDDSRVQITVLGAEMEETYDGTVTARSYMAVQGTCGDAPAQGNYLVTRDSETGDMYCYGLDRISQLDWSMFYLPRGNLLAYRRLD
ncbi:DUF1036 domain-containing protein [Oceanicola sp. 22II-s10i]|uniref:DUF1036 domain-containing protein n=1 Tax=Oceanicola sp. 22II-s10i TaxID=1317116 RepID=UPI000B51F347|nr:DUF1036 domain-containing protein [Oceanicola sp. 22II-s10i]